MKLLSEEFEKTKKDLLKYLNELKDNFEYELLNKKKKYNNIKNELENLLKKIENKDEEKQLIDERLIFSIWIILGVVAFLFFILISFSKFYDKEIVIKLIESRILTEIIGIVFILLTIIILAIGQKIGIETLGTLLGIIAGYVFGRKSVKNEN